MKLIVPALQISGDEGFSAELDIFNRKAYGEGLLNLIRNTDDELVVALDAQWGEGKSTFIKMWQGLLQENNIPHIYFDAFENDYQADPFLAISGEIYRLAEKYNEKTSGEFKKNATSALKVLGQAGLRITLKTLTAGVFDQTVLDEIGTDKDAAKETADIVDKYIANRLAKSNEDKATLVAFKKHLSQLSEEIGNNEPIIFIIDELDRCKPDFALSLIESIKHLFSVPKVTFLLVMNRIQMEEAVRHQYGSGVDATRYLQKFISISTTLPKPNDQEISIPKTYLNHCLNNMGYEVKTTAHQQIIEIFEDLVSFYDLSLREIEKSLTNFAIIHNATSGNLQLHNSIISVFFSIIKTTKPHIFREICSGRITYPELVTEASLKGLENEWWPEAPESHPVKWLLRYYFGTPDEARELIRQGNPFHFNYTPGQGRSSLNKICAWMDAFKKG